MISWFRKGLAIGVFSLLVWAVPTPSGADCFTAQHDPILAITCLQARVDAGVARDNERRGLDRRLGRLGLNGPDFERFNTGYGIRPRFNSTNLLNDNGESGVELGFGGHAELRSILAPGQIMRFRISASEAVEPLTLDRRARRGVSACAQSVLGQRHIGVCNATRSYLRRGSTTLRNNLRLTFAEPYKISPTRQGVLRLGVERADHLTDEYAQHRLHLEHGFVDHRDGYTHLGLSYGLPVKGRHLMRWRVDQERRWGVFVLGAHVQQKSGQGYDSLGLGASLGFQRVSRFGLRVGFRAVEDGRTDEWEVRPTLRFNYRF